MKTYHDGDGKKLLEDLRNWRGQMGDEFEWVAEFERGRVAYQARKRTGVKKTTHASCPSSAAPVA